MVYVANTATVDSSCIIRDEARVEGNSVLFQSQAREYAIISGSVKLVSSSVYGSAKVSGNVVIELSSVKEDAHIYGEVKIISGTVGGSARIEGHAVLINSKADDNAHIYGNAALNRVEVSDNSSVFGNAYLVSEEGEVISVELRGDCKFGGTATFKGLKTFEDFVKKYGANKVELTGKNGRNSYSRITLTDVWDMG